MSTSKEKPSADSVGEIELHMKSYDVVFKKFKKSLLNRIRVNRYMRRFSDDREDLRLIKERWFLGERILRIKFTCESELLVDPGLVR